MVFRLCLPQRRRNGGGVKPLPLEDISEEMKTRVLSRVPKGLSPNACWPWMGNIRPDGYGQFYEWIKGERGNRSPRHLPRRTEGDGTMNLRKTEILAAVGMFVWFAAISLSLFGLMGGDFKWLLGLRH